MPIRDTLMGIEGTAGRIYLDGVRALLDGKAPFPGRTGRGAIDPVNALLNYGYGILYQCVWGAAINAGLEPFAGFLHATLADLSVSKIDAFGYNGMHVNSYGYQAASHQCPANRGLRPMKPDHRPKPRARN